MAIRDLLGGKSVEKGLSARHDRRNRFRIQRYLNDRGFEVYRLENSGKGERVNVPRHLYDRFRATVRGIRRREIEAGEKARIDDKLMFGSAVHYIFRTVADHDDLLMIQEVNPGPGSTGYMTLNLNAVAALDRLLYDDYIRHPSDTMARIIAYHKLFQFSFVEGSDSINSDLTLRRDVLSQVDSWMPTPGKKVSAGLQQGKGGAPGARPTGKGSGKKKAHFKSRLAQREGHKPYKVDYQALFSSKQSESVKAPKAAENQPKKSDGGVSRTCFPLPLPAGEIKSFARTPFRCEFTTDEVQELREIFLGDMNNDYYLGFEVVDAIFKRHGNLKTFRFPLYYMKVAIRQAGREIYLEPLENNRIYLNHLALANLVDTFGKHGAGMNPVDHFFKALLAQTLQVGDRPDRVHLTRLLPFEEGVYEKTRELLLGFADENGKGGLLANLNLAGLELDVESTYLYQSRAISDPVSAALEADLDRIQDKARENPGEFYQSLLGRFLTPEALQQQPAQDRFCEVPWIPGALPPASRALLDRLNQHDLVLLEGPPGTGKTFTIMNLFIHCVCTGKRMLVVSDKDGAIHALTEKIQEYLLDKDRDSPASRNMELLWRTAIKVVDQAPTGEGNMTVWTRMLREMLKVEDQAVMDWPAEEDGLRDEIRAIDKEMEEIQGRIRRQLDKRLGPAADYKQRVTPKPFHATTKNDIANMVAFLQFIGTRSGNFANLRLIRDFIRNRESLAGGRLAPCYDFFRFPSADDETWEPVLYETAAILKKVISHKPRSLNAFLRLCGKADVNPVLDHLAKRWMASFPPAASRPGRVWRRFLSWFRHPVLAECQTLYQAMSAHKKLNDRVRTAGSGVLEQMHAMHEALHPDSEDVVPLSLEICRFSIKSLLQGEPDSEESVQTLLDQCAVLQTRRDILVKKQAIGRLGSLARHCTTSVEGGTSPTTSILALLDSMKNLETIEEATGDLLELQKKLVETFPIWICRKQAVSFLFPCAGQSFDLVIVDEATQCRVDDALPLLYRAKKLMVVGDDKQTVLARNSAIDDYLFEEFQLAEHLRSTQARGMKGGGSHIFGLVKTIKQASVMLEEHYRCPPDIIRYSNQYVYGSELKIMQWARDQHAGSVYVNYNESRCSPSNREERGKFKGIETRMVDRYMQWVAETIKQIERETGKRINTETDVALCYFLLKNEPYVKSLKGDFLHKLGRGAEILDGAGAALQGKERDYIFYLWDINRSNMMAFRQGDDPDKRKGELNVLMSRPKRRAYHYLHRNFKALDHGSSSITDYLWRTYQDQNAEREKEHYVPRTRRPGNDFIPWRRSSGQLITNILQEVLGRSRDWDGPVPGDRSMKVRTSVVVGNPRHKVDLVLMPNSKKDDRTSLGIVDLCGFEPGEAGTRDLVDYYFQLQRCHPPLRPMFMFMHELANESSSSFEQLKLELEEMIHFRKAG